MAGALLHFVLTTLIANSVAAEVVSSSPMTKSQQAPPAQQSATCQPASSQLTKDVRSLAGMTEGTKVAGVYSEWRSRESWNRLNEKQKQLIREFAAKQMPEAANNTKTVFYPFGGPDAVFPSLFFPKMSTMILAGLEEPGTLYQPPANDPNGADFKKHVSDIRQAYVELFRHGYFITSKMSKELQEFGTTTMITVGLALMCNEIDNIEYIRLDANGNPIPLKTGDPKYGVKITYTSPDGEKRSIYYFKQNLSNGNLQASFPKFLKSQKIDTSFYKASMYAPHMQKAFSKINVIAREARYVVQSDSGLKINEFQADKKWKVNLFGQYVAPDKMFGVQTQEELKVAYANSICKSDDAEAKKHFADIWQADACSTPLASTAATSRYAGPLPFRYDYAGKLSPQAIANFSSNFMYAVRNETPSEPDSSFVNGK